MPQDLGSRVTYHSLWVLIGLLHQSSSQLSRVTAAWPLLCFLGGAEEASRDTGEWQLGVGSRQVCKMTQGRGWEGLSASDPQC